MCESYLIKSILSDFEYSDQLRHAVFTLNDPHFADGGVTTPAEPHEHDWIYHMTHDANGESGWRECAHCPAFEDRKWVAR